MYAGINSITMNLDLSKYIKRTWFIFFMIYSPLTISENKTITESKTERLKSKLKSNNTSIVNSTKSETLYESTEISRMKQLAGIKTLND